MTFVISRYSLLRSGLSGISFYSSISGLVKSEMFPVQIRGLAVGMSFAISNALFGGTAEYVALWFKDRGTEIWFFWYVTVMMVIAFLVALRLPSKPSYLHDDH